MLHSSLTYWNKPLDVYVNPSRLELSRIRPHHGDYRGLLFLDKLFIWDANGPLHYQMRDMLGIDARDKFYGILVRTERKTIEVYYYGQTSDKDYKQNSVFVINNNNIIKRLFQQYKVHYEYNEDNFITVEDLANAAQEL